MMAREYIDKCDVDGTVKGDGNNWFMARRLFQPHGDTLCITHWAQEHASDDEYKQLCGQRCTTEYLQAWMDGKIVAP